MATERRGGDKKKNKFLKRRENIIQFIKKVFATIEKEIRKKEEIVTPEEYINIFKQHGKVFHLGKDIPDSDWKDAGKQILKPVSQWHMKFNQCKRFIIKRGKNNNITIHGELSYRSDMGVSKGVFKKNKFPTNIKPKTIPTGKRPKNLKLKDVSNLLKKHYGNEWHDMETLKYYKNVLEKYYNTIPEENNDHEDNDFCEKTDEFPETRV
ncbi:hypothetical protein ABEB36_000149 [Hypothenemus hampei]|uniref:Uncharacterized protein n=1 Tax=Hypothenemus hampei TaxID=57062 RepID=A0ABD1FB49_HYPHA